MRLLLLLIVFISVADTAKSQTLDTIISLDNLDIYKTITGKASFYSKNLHGTETSTGERYDNNKMTAASNFFKLNTWVRVTNSSSGESIIVRINDRMHPRMARRGRVIDLSRIAATKLDFINEGIIKVQIIEIDKPVKSVTFLTKKYQNL